MLNRSREQLMEIAAKARREAAAYRGSMQDAEMDELLFSAIEESVISQTTGQNWSAAEKKEMVQSAFHAMRRHGVLEPLIWDPEITEIMVNGPDAVFVEKNGRVEHTDIRFESREQLIDLIMQIASGVNRSVNEAEPIVDARLADGSRMNAVLQPVALNGPLLTIRKFPRDPMKLEDLVRLQAITSEAADFLSQLVKAKFNIFVSGGTGSGKTTMLNALSAKIPPSERIVTIEDSAELQLHSIENLARLETRTMNTEGRGEISIKNLIRTSLRMRPDRVIVGEVRGEEALDMLQAMNTGHDGSMSTGHANSAADMLSRLETMVLMAAPLPLQAIRKQIASALDIIVFLSRMRDNSRKVIEISEVVGILDGEIQLSPLYLFEEDTTCSSQMLSGRLKKTGATLVHTDKLVRCGMMRVSNHSTNGQKTEKKRESMFAGEVYG